MDLLIDILGWAGAIAVLAGYFLVSNNKVKGDSLFYQMLNLAGGVFLLIHTFYEGAFASAFVNVVWIVIAVVALSKMQKGVFSKIWPKN